MALSGQDPKAKTFEEVLYEDFTFLRRTALWHKFFRYVLLTARHIVCDVCCDTRGADYGAQDPGGLILNKRQWSAVSGLAVGALVVTGLTAPMQAQATPVAKAPVSGDPAAAQASQPDNLPNPLAEAQTAERKDAVAKLLKGEATTKTINGNRVIEVKTGKDKNGKPAQVQVRQLPGRP